MAKKQTTISIDVETKKLAEQKELDEAIADAKLGKNIDGPYVSVEDLIKSMKK